MNNEYTLFGHPKTRSTRIGWMLEELNVPYQYHVVQFMKGDHKSPEFLAINPAGKVPALKIDNGESLLESGAIVNFLADNYTDKKLAPLPATKMRAFYDQWCCFALTELEQSLWTMGKHKFALPAEQRVKEVLPTAQWEFQQALGLLSEALGDHDYILGRYDAEWDRFTAADLLITHTLLWGINFKQPVEQENLQAYVDRNCEREGFKRCIEMESSLT